MLAEATITDAELVQRTLAGDDHAYHQLFDRHRGRVTAVCRQRLRSASDVDDAVQEAFVRALAKLDQLRDPDSFGPWIRSIAVRACMDHHRVAQRLIPVDDEQHGETADTAPLPDEMLLAAERDASLRATFGELGERDRRALWMRHVSEAPVAAVALELGLTEGSTRVLLTRARHRLRAATSALPALIPVSWRQWIRDHLPVTTPALDALAVAVVLTLAGGGFAADAGEPTPPVQDTTPAAAATTDGREPAAAAKARRPGREEHADAPAPALDGAAGPGAPGNGGRPGALDRVGNSVQIGHERPSEDETDELFDVKLFTGDTDANDDVENSFTLYAREVKPAVDAGREVLGLSTPAEDASVGQR